MPLMRFSIIMTQCFPAIDKFFWKSMFPLLYSRGCYYAPSEIVQN